MREFGGVSRRDSELRDAVARRIKRRRQWQVVQGRHAKVAQRWTVNQSLSGCQQRRRKDSTEQIRVGSTQAVLVMVLESRLAKTSKSRA